MTPEIKDFPGGHFIGMRRNMSLTANATLQLWQTFMPRHREVSEQPDEIFYSIEVYPEGYYEQFNPSTKFEKWAVLEAEESDKVPEGMEMLTVGSGQYAVFTYKGKPSEAAPFYQNIFTKWLPEMGFAVDDRPHFAVMDERYRGDSNDSEEELWIPVK